MKVRVVVFTIASYFFTNALVFCDSDQVIDLQLPLLINNNVKNRPLMDVLFPLPDLRERFIPKDILSKAATDKRCIFDGSNRRLQICTISVGNGTPLKEVLTKVGMGNWLFKGGPLKIIKAETIMQSPEGRFTSESQAAKAAKFIETLIEPGDAVYCTPLFY